MSPPTQAEVTGAAQAAIAAKERFQAQLRVQPVSLDTLRDLAAARNLLESEYALLLLRYYGGRIDADARAELLPAMLAALMVDGSPTELSLLDIAAALTGKSVDEIERQREQARILLMALADTRPSGHELN